MISLAAGGKRKMPHATSVVDPALINSFHELCSSRHQYERAKEEKAAACSMSRPLGPASGQMFASFSFIRFHPSTSDSADSSPTVILALITHLAAGGENCQHGEHLWRAVAAGASKQCCGQWKQHARERSSSAANEGSSRAQQPAESRRVARRPLHLLSPFLSPPAMIFPTCLCSQPAYLAP